MKKVNNEQIKNAYQRWTTSTDSTLEDVYKNCSTAKYRAYRYCVELMNKYNGYGLKILGHNCDFFSVGFMATVDGVNVFCYITHANDYFIPVENL